MKAKDIATEIVDAHMETNALTATSLTRIKEDIEIAILRERARSVELENALRGIIEIGKRNTENPKYDSYYNEARKVLGLPPLSERKAE